MTPDLSEYVCESFVSFSHPTYQRMSVSSKKNLGRFKVLCSIRFFWTNKKILLNYGDTGACVDSDITLDLCRYQCLFIVR